MGAKMPYGGVGLKVGQVVAATRAVLIPTVGVVQLAPIPVVAAAANSGFKFRATGRVANGGISADVCWGLLFWSSPSEDVMASSFAIPTDGANCCGRTQRSGPMRANFERHR